MEYVNLGKYLEVIRQKIWKTIRNLFDCLHWQQSDEILCNNSSRSDGTTSIDRRNERVEEIDSASHLMREGICMFLKRLQDSPRLFHHILSYL